MLIFAHLFPDTFYLQTKIIAKKIFASAGPASGQLSDGNHEFDLTNESAGG